MGNRIKACDRYSQDELGAAFDRVADPRDWRAPINAVIAPDRRTITACAIVHFTATKPRFTPLGNPGSSAPKMLLVRALGYRAGPAGDH